MNYDTHLCLISQQAAPNLLPILDEQFKPKKAIFMVSNSMKKNAESLKSVFERKQIKVEIINLIDEYNFHEMKTQFLEIAEKYENENIALNVTGGTKLISIAAAEAFSCITKPIFYIDTNQNKILFLHLDEKNKRLEDHALNTKIDLKTYLNSYGNKIIKTGENLPKYENLLGLFEEQIIKNYEENKNIISSLNKYASEAKETSYKCKIYETPNIFSNFLEQLDKEEIIQYKNREINFIDKETHEFLSGGWLEYYAYNKIKNIKKINDISLNMKIGNSYHKDKIKYHSQNKGNNNEIDVIFLAKNRLHLIECKTGRMDKTEKIEDIIYKLETLTEYGGIMTKKCLISYFEVPEKIMNRAKSYKIEIIQGEQLKRLEQYINNWIA